MKDYNEYQLVIQLLIPQSFSYKENELFAKQITCLFLAFPFIIGYL